MAEEDLPVPPGFELTGSWAGPARVIRPSAAAVAGWDLPAGQKEALTVCGVPLLEGIVDTVLFAAEPREAGYRLAGAGEVPRRPDRVYVAEPGTGRVSELELPGGRCRFVNSTVNHWLCSLHLAGALLSGSEAIQAWDEDGAAEEAALAELAGLLREIARLDPPAYGADGDHETHFWPAVLDRWLY